MANREWGSMLTDIGIRRKRSLSRRIIQNYGLLSAHYIPNERHRVRGCFADAVTHVHRYILSFSGRFRLYQQLIISRTDQQAALGACMLYGSAHELVAELFQSNLARDSLRYLDHGRERGVRRTPQSY